MTSVHIKALIRSTRKTWNAVVAYIGALVLYSVLTSSPSNNKQCSCWYYHIPDQRSTNPSGFFASWWAMHNGFISSILSLWSYSFTLISSCECNNLMHGWCIKLCVTLCLSLFSTILKSNPLSLHHFLPKIQNESMRYSCKQNLWKQRRYHFPQQPSSHARNSVMQVLWQSIASELVLTFMHTSVKTIRTSTKRKLSDDELGKLNFMVNLWF